MTSIECIINEYPLGITFSLSQTNELVVSTLGAGHPLEMGEGDRLKQINNEVENSYNFVELLHKLLTHNLELPVRLLFSPSNKEGEVEVRWAPRRRA